jgi:hypothetical protein
VAFVTDWDGEQPPTGTPQVDGSTARLRVAPLVVRGGGGVQLGGAL